MNKITTPGNITPPTPIIVNSFSLPTSNCSVNFAVNSTYSNATFDDNMLCFTDLCIDESFTFERFEVLVQNANLTIFSCTTVRAIGFQSIRLDYTVNVAGKQVLSFGPLPEEGGCVEWSVMCGNVFLTEGRDWSVSDDNKTITVDSANGAVSVVRYYFSDSFDKPGLTFVEQHLVTIVIGTALTMILLIAVFVKQKIKKQEGDYYI